MNERLKQLATQARNDTNKFQSFEDGLAEYSEKLANLIIEECCNVDLYWLSEENRKSIAEKIRAHFGSNQS